MIRPSPLPLVAALLVARVSHADVGTCLKAAEDAQPLKAHGRLLAARRELRICAAADCPSQVRVDCGRWLDEVERAVPSIVIRARDGQGHDVPNVKLAIDDGPLGPLDGLPRELDPGHHRIRLEAPPRAAFEQDLIVHQSERDRLVLVAFEDAPSKESARPTPGESSTPPWILGVGGALVASAGAAFWFFGSREHDDLAGSCAKTASCAHDDVVAARTKLIVGDVLVGVGVISLGVAVALAIVQPRSPSASRAAWLTF